MPEAPHMQALAERLDVLVGRCVLEGVDPLHFAALKTVAPGPDSVVGLTLERVGRRGKYLLLDFGGPRVLVHLSQGGRIDVEDPPKATRPRGAVVRFRFAGAPALLVREHGSERKARWWVLGPGDGGPLAGLGPEADSPEFAVFLHDGQDRRRLHTLLRDQRTVAGIGRGFADDVLHRAGLSPYATLAGLDVAARDRLVEAVGEVLARGLETERTRSGGLPAKLGGHFAVHGRWGTPCPGCGETLRRVSFASREVTYCPACQTAGKVLADRRLSRLVR